MIINDYMNNHIDSSKRATLLSAKNFFDNLGIFALFLLISYFIKVKSLEFSLSVLAISVFIGYLILWFYSKKVKLNFKQES